MHLSLDLYGMFAFTEVSNGLEAVRIVMNQPFDVIVTDIKMPKMDGIEATRRIREFSKVPIIVVSAYVDDKTRQAAKGAGADLFMSKPVDHQRLAARIRYFKEQKQISRDRTHDQTDQLRALQRRLGKLELLQAQRGTHSPADIAIDLEIDAVRDQIEWIELEMTSDDIR